MIQKQEKEKIQRNIHNNNQPTNQPTKPVSKPFEFIKYSKVITVFVESRIRFVHWTTSRPVHNISLLCLAVIKIIYLNVMLLTRLIVLYTRLFECIYMLMWCDTHTGFLMSFLLPSLKILTNDFEWFRMWPRLKKRFAKLLSIICTYTLNMY